MKFNGMEEDMGQEMMNCGIIPSICISGREKRMITS